MSTSVSVVSSHLLLLCTLVSDNAADGTFSALNDLPNLGCISTLAEGTPNATNGGASEIRITNDGRFAYAAIRFTGKDNGPPAADGADPDQSGWAVFNQIAILSLDTATGAVKLIDSVPSGGNMPWTFQLIENDSKMVGAVNSGTFCRCKLDIRKIHHDCHLYAT